MINVQIPESQIRDFCQRYHVRTLELFGSVLRDDFRAESDVDVLVEFEEDARPTLRDLLAMEQELSKIFGRKVDLGEREAVLEDPNPIRRQHILNSTKVIYAR